jgi:hypothetical protein
MPHAASHATEDGGGRASKTEEDNKAKHKQARKQKRSRAPAKKKHGQE